MQKKSSLWHRLAAPLRGLLAVVLFAGGTGIAWAVPNPTDNPTVENLQENGDTPVRLTSLEAADRAYQEALKWREDAVFWYMVAHTLRKNCLEPDWADSDQSPYWLIKFANPETEEEFTVIIDNGRIVKTRTGFGRKNPCKPEFPLNRPGVSLKKAAKTIFANGAPRDLKPTVCYVVDNMNRQFAGRPVWQFAFEEPREDASDLYFAFVVDGLTGRLLEIHDAAGNALTPSDLAALRGATAELSTEPSYRDVVDRFLKALTHLDPQAAVLMMDNDMAPTAEMRAMWVTGLSGFDTVKVKSVEEYGREKWTSDLQVFHVTFDVVPKEDAPYTGWDKGLNERWIQVRPEDGVWRIHALGTGP